MDLPVQEQHPQITQELLDQHKPAEQRSLDALLRIEKLMEQLVRNTTTPVTQAAERAHEKRKGGR